MDAGKAALEVAVKATQRVRGDRRVRGHGDRSKLQRGRESIDHLLSINGDGGSGLDVKCVRRDDRGAYQHDAENNDDEQHTRCRREL